MFVFVILFFLQIEIATLTHKFSSVTLYKNKTVRYAARMHAIIACQMEFQLYPMDIQICPIYIESCEYAEFSSHLFPTYFHPSKSFFFQPILIVRFIQFDILYWRCFNIDLSYPTAAHSRPARSVSYPTQKVRLQWDGGDGGVVLNPELKLLQYNLGQPLEVAETIEYMPQKHGKINDCSGECSQMATTFQRFSCQLGHISEVLVIIVKILAIRLVLLTFARKAQRF